MPAITILEYQTLMLGILDTLKTDIIAPNSAGSDIETRYIAPESQDDEEWLGYLRNDSAVVDRWLLMPTSLTGLNPTDDQSGSVGTFKKPTGIIMDYFADYRQGLDEVGAVGSETVTNTEREFLKKLFAIDLALEKKRGCLGGNVYIDSWDFRIKLRRFKAATVHWASGIIQLRVADIFL